MKIKFYSVILLVVLVISILPLVNLSRYNHPSADDFGLAVNTKAVWDANHSVTELLKEVHESAIEYCSVWEGTYASYYLWGMMPAIFGERYYKLTGLINIAILGFSTMLFFVVFVKKILRGKIYHGIALGSIALLLMFLYMPSVVEGLYWYCGAVGYNFFWGMILLILTGLMLYSGEKSIWNIIDIVLMSIGGIILAGGNHVTSFTGMLAFAIIGIWAMTSREKKRFRIIIPVLIFTIAGFIVNVTAPGTSVRASNFPQRTGVVETIWLALQNGLWYIGDWISLPLIFGIILSMPVIICLLDSFMTENDFKFQWPLLVFAVSVGFFCAMLCPTLFVMQNTGGGRVHNAQYFTFIVLIMLNSIYFTGYGLYRLKERGIIVDWKEKIPFKYLLLIGVFGMGILIWPIRESSSYCACQTIASGEAEKYSDEAQTRYELSIESEGQDLELMDFTVKPELLFFDDIRTEKGHGNNIMYADYYNLNSVILKYWE